MFAWLSFTKISLCDLLHQIPLGHPPQSTVDLAPGLLAQAPRCCTFKETFVPVWGMYGCGKGCLCDSNSIQPVTDKLLHFQQSQMFHLCPKQLPQRGDQTPASVTPPVKGRGSLDHSPLFCPHSFFLLSFALVYTFFSGGQVLLPTLSWCFARSSVSGGVFLMYPWREMHSVSTYSSTILDLPNSC